MKLRFSHKLLALLTTAPLVSTVLLANSCQTNTPIVFSFNNQTVINAFNEKFSKQTLNFTNFIKNKANFTYLETEATSLLFINSADKKDPLTALSKQVDNQTDPTVYPQFFFAASNWTSANKTAFKKAVAQNVSTFLSLLVMVGWLYQYHYDATKTALKNLNYIDKTSYVSIFLNYLNTNHYISTNYMNVWFWNIKNLFDKKDKATTFIRTLLTSELGSTSQSLSMGFLSNKQASPSALKPNFDYQYQLSLNSSKFVFNLTNYTPQQPNYYLENAQIGSKDNPTDFTFDDYYKNAITNLDNGFKRYLVNNPSGNLQTFLTNSQTNSVLTQYVNELSAPVKKLNSDVDNYTKNNTFFNDNNAAWTNSARLQFAQKLEFNIINNIYGSTLIMGLMYQDDSYKTSTKTLLDQDNFTPGKDLDIPFNAYATYLLDQSTFSKDTYANLLKSGKAAFDHQLDASLVDVNPMVYAMYTYDWHSSFALTLPKITFNPVAAGNKYNFQLNVSGKPLSFSVFLQLNGTSNLAFSQLDWNKITV